jgi:sulfatase modifying factor 1
MKMGGRAMKSINSMRILLAALCAIILTGIAGCGGTETETIVQITEPVNNTSTQQNTIHILGKVENTDTTMAQVTVNGEEQQANIVNGSFDANITLIDGNNIIKVSVDGVVTQVYITKIKQTTDSNEIIIRDSAPMVLIPAGEFQMGSNGGEDDEKPVHMVYLDAFYIDKYEVTNAQYKKFIDTTGHKEPLSWNASNQPVWGVGWHDAVAYAEWAGKRLPTEAEWEKAARGGLVGGNNYVWGDEWPPPTKAGNFADESLKNMYKSWIIIAGYDDGYAYTAPVGSFNPNGYGLYDMAGNVLEWCADWYDNNYYNSSEQNPTGPSTGNLRVLRGGSWGDSSAANLRVARRRYNALDPTTISVGFRCVK